MRKGLNTDFLSPEELAELGVSNARDRNILIHRTCVILDFARIEFGKNIRIDPFCVITCKQLKLGEFIHIGTGCGLSGAGNITVSDFANISHNCLLFTSSDDYSGHSLTNPMVPSEFTNVHTEDLTIGKHAILGARSIVLPGANVSEGVSTGAGTLVKNPLDPWTIYAGAPAKPFKPRDKGCLAREEELRAFLANTTTGQ